MASTRSTWVVRLVVLLVATALVVVLRRVVFAPDPIAVQAGPAELGVVESTITNTKAGTIRARTRAGLSTGASGIVTSLTVDRGDRVKRDQELLRLEDSRQRAELLVAERQRDVAQARHARVCVATERARREVERNERLTGESAPSEDRIDALRTALELALAECQVALSEVLLAEASVEVAQTELNKTVLKAPFNAVIADVSIEVGEWVTPSVPLLAAPDLMDAIDPSSLYVSAPMDEVDATLVRVGLPVRVTIDSHPGRDFAGKVARIAPYVLDVEQQNRTLEVEVILDDSSFSATLLPGTSADVEVILDTRTDVLRVPTFSLLDGDRVYVVEEGRLRKRVVGTGIRNWDWVEVLDGLAPGDLVVSGWEGEDISEGAEVQVRSDGDDL